MTEQFKLTPKIIEKLDRFAPSPEEHAATVYGLLKERCSELDNYQLQCFAIQFLAAQALSNDLGYAVNEIRQLNAIFYYAHYLRVSEKCLSEVQADSGPTLHIVKSGSDLNLDLMKKDESSVTSPQPDSKIVLLP